MEQAVTRLEEQTKTLFNYQARLEERLEKHEDDDKQAFADITKRLDEIMATLSNRLPNWATWVLSICCTIIGVLATLLAVKGG